jgi:hypothetical protein
MATSNFPSASVSFKESGALSVPESQGILSPWLLLILLNPPSLA